MADIRIKDLATTASVTASDDFMAVDGSINGTRKLSAATPAFLTSVTTPSLTSPAATNLTLGTTDSGAAITVLAASNNVGIGTITPSTKLSVFSSNQEIATFAHPSTSTTANNGGAILKIQNTSNTNGNMQSLLFRNSTDTASSGIFGYNTNQITGEGFLTFSTRNSSGTFATALTLASTGDVSISSTTAASSNAGALVVAGGLATGAASYFGGAINATGTGITLNDGNGRILVLLPPQTATSNIARLGTTSNHPLILQAGNATGLTITEITGAATFAGAVTIGGNVGFYNNTPVAKPTGVAVTAAAIHAALVTLNLIAA